VLFRGDRPMVVGTGDLNRDGLVDYVVGAAFGALPHGVSVFLQTP